MKILHISDLHLGKIVNGFSMIEMQSDILNQSVEVLSNQNIDTLVIAGDIYDRSIPPGEAVELLDAFLTRVGELNITVLIINGNHDSAIRLNFAHQLLLEKNIIIESDNNKLYSKIQIGDTCFYMISFKTPKQCEVILEKPITDYNEMMKEIIDSIELCDEAKHHIAITHNYIVSQKSETIISDSERHLSLGGSEFVSSEVFKQFDAVLAGHIHRHQHIKPNVYYSGSIYPYSFSEENNKNGYYIFDISSDQINAKYHSYDLKRKFVTITGRFDDLIRENKYDDNYVCVRLLDEVSIHNPIERLRKLYPHLMIIEQPKRNFQEIDTEDIETTDIISSFKSFFQESTERAMREEEHNLLIKTYNKLEEGEK